MSTVTFSIFVPQVGRRKAGQFNVRIRVTFKRVSRYISTNIIATDRDLDSTGHLKGPVLVRASALLGSFYQYSSELNFFALQNMQVDDVVRFVLRRAVGPTDFSLDFFEFAEKEIIPTKSAGTAKNYSSALNAFRRYLGAGSIDINEITREMLAGFVKFIEQEQRQVYVHAKQEVVTGAISKKNATNAAHAYLGRLRYIYEAAQHKYNDEDKDVLLIPRKPFAKIKVEYTPSIVRSAKSVEFIQSLINFDGPCSPSQRIALDMYLISFALMGMNAADMLTAGPPEGDVIIYHRKKTRNRRVDQAEHHVLIDPRIRGLVRKYADPEGTHLFRLHKLYKNNVTMDGALRYNLDSWAAKNGVEPFTMYSARHSWATIARSSACRIDKGTIDDCLCHLGGNRLVDVYAEKDWSLLWNANKKVLDLFDWSPLDTSADKA